MATSGEEIKLKHQLDMCFKLLEQYSWLLDAYVLDFFTDNHIWKLNSSWKELFDCIGLEEIPLILTADSHNSKKKIFPLSLICIKALIQLLSLPRMVAHSNDLSMADCIKSNQLNLTLIPISYARKRQSLISQYPKLWNSFLKHVKPKKRYEIFKMAELTSQTANKLNINYVVDIGSGLGHLSRVLAYGFNMNVCSVETQEQLTMQARRLDSEFITTAIKYLSPAECETLKSKSPVQLNQTIKLNLDLTEFVNKLKTTFSVSQYKGFKFGIVGLHPCGDLASILLKMYTTCPEAKFIKLVGCCYHKLTTASDVSTDLGFPISDFCGTKEQIRISAEARALACHAIETYSQRLISKDHDHLKVHCFRAALEKIIQKNWPTLKKTSLSNVKCDREMDFNRYCQLSLKKFNFTVPCEDINASETIMNLSQWREVIKFYSLRLMFAPLVETAILLDRKLYLLEKGLECHIQAAFDPTLSPRNQLLLSEKFQ